MNVLVILIPVSLILGGLGAAAFIWTLRSEQYDDPDGDAARILLDDEEGPGDGASDPDAPDSAAPEPAGPDTGNPDT